MLSNQITVQELAQIRKDKQAHFLLDVRNVDEYQVFNLNGYLIPLVELPYRLDEIPVDKPIVVYCRSGHRSQTALNLLQAAGFEQVKNLLGGVLAWQRAFGE